MGKEGNQGYCIPSGLSHRALGGGIEADCRSFSLSLLSIGAGTTVSLVFSDLRVQWSQGNSNVHEEVGYSNPPVEGGHRELTNGMVIDTSLLCIKCVFADSWKLLELIDSFLLLSQLFIMDVSSTVSIEAPEKL